VLNDWPDRQTAVILRRAPRRPAPTAASSPRRGDAGRRTPWRLEIEVALLGGKSNTLAEFRELARQAGLEVLLGEAQPSGDFVLECRPT